MSQVKQIAGRAGRFGLHGSGIEGVATTLRQEDLPALREIYDGPIPTIPRARVSYHVEDVAKVLAVFGAGTPLDFVLSSLNMLARTGTNYIMRDASGSIEVARVIEKNGPGLTLDEKMLIANVPVNIRNEVLSEALGRWISDHLHGRTVDYEASLVHNNLMFTVNRITQLEKEATALDEKRIRQADIAALAAKNHSASPPSPPFSSSPPSSTASPSSPLPSISPRPAYVNPNDLERLENAHQMASAYLWLSFRIPLTFNRPTEARALKERVETCLQFVLDKVSNQNAVLRERKNVEIAARREAKKQGLPDPNPPWQTTSAFDKPKPVGYQPESVEKLRRKREVSREAEGKKIKFTRPGDEADLERMAGENVPVSLGVASSLSDLL